MATIITRSGKGSPLTNTEVDNNFTNLNTAKYESGDSPSFVTTSTTNLTVSADTGIGASVSQSGVTNSQTLGVSFTGGNVGSTSPTAAVFRVTSNSNLRPWAAFGDTHVFHGSGAVTFNDTGGAYDFRVESDTNTHMLFVDAGANHVNIGASSDLGGVLNVHGGKVVIDGSVSPYDGELWLGWNVSGRAEFFYDFSLGDLTINNTWGDPAASMYFKFAGSTKLDLRGDGSLVHYGATVHNENGGDFDFRVESDTNTHALFVDAGTSNVGINQSAPTSTLNVSGNKSFVWNNTGIENVATLLVGNRTIVDSQNAFAVAGTTHNTYYPAAFVIDSQYGGFGTNSTNFDLTAYGVNYTGWNGSMRLRVSQNTGVHEAIRITPTETTFNELSTDADFRVESDTNTHMLFVDAANNRVGIGDSSPDRTLEVAGNVRTRGLGSEANASSLRVGLDYEASSGIAGPQYGVYVSQIGARYTDQTAVWATTPTPNGQYGSNYKLFAGEASTSTKANQKGFGLDVSIFNPNGNYTTQYGAKTYVESSMTSVIGFDSRTRAYGGYFETRGNGTLIGNRSIAVQGTAVASGAYAAAYEGYVNGNLHFQVRDEYTVINESSADHDFRVESDAQSHMLFVDASANAVGINNSAPSGVRLSVHGGAAAALAWGDTSDRGFLSFDVSGNPIVRATTGLDLKFQVNAARDVLTLGASEAVFNAPSNDQDFRVVSDTNTHALFVDASTDKLYVGGTTDLSDRMTVVTNAGVFNGLSIGNSSNNSIALGNFTSADVVSNLITSSSKFGGIVQGGTNGNLVLGIRDNDSSDGLFVISGAADQQTNDYSRLRLSITSNTFVVNETGDDADFRVESDTNTHALFVDAGNSRVGIGSSSPANVLDLGSATANRGISWGNTSGNYTNIWAKYSNGNLVLATGLAPKTDATGYVSSYQSASLGHSVLEIGAFGTPGTLKFSSLLAQNQPVGTELFPLERFSSSTTAFVVNDGGIDYDFRVESDSNTHALFVDASTNAVVIHNNNKLTTGGFDPALSIDGTSNAAFFRNSTGGAVQGMQSGGTTGAQNFLVFYNQGGTSIGTVSTSNGNTGTTVAYNTSSDARLKTNIVDAPDAGALIDDIKVRQFDWIENGEHQRYGMVAQELMTVAPEAVSGDPESDDMMGVDYSKLVPMLVKEIQSLRARIAALEAK